jgi:hypothetical protein
MNKAMKMLNELGYKVVCSIRKEPRLGDYLIQIDVKTKELIQPEIIYTFRYSSNSLEEIKKQVEEWLKETFNIMSSEKSYKFFVFSG